MTILKAQRLPGAAFLRDPSHITADLLCNDSEGSQEQIVMQVSALREALNANRGMGILDVLLPGEPSPRHVIINRFAKSDDGRKLTHLFLKEVSDTDRIRVMVPVTLIGLMPARRRHVIVTQTTKAVDLRGPVAVLDRPIRIRVSEFAPGDVVRASDLELPEGVVLCSDPEQEIFRVEERMTA
ncbi:MAG TPA: hypothetical protein VHE55_15710 [Fimbriimonadaceae bacterium]|nr:hypothetical protein [Fimbriimonadaceae bacterium]